MKILFTLSAASAFAHPEICGNILSQRPGDSKYELRVLSDASEVPNITHKGALVQASSITVGTHRFHSYVLQLGSELGDEVKYLVNGVEHKVSTGAKKIIAYTNNASSADWTRIAAQSPSLLVCAGGQGAPGISTLRTLQNTQDRQGAQVFEAESTKLAKHYAALYRNPKFREVSAKTATIMALSASDIAPGIMHATNFRDGTGLINSLTMSAAHKAHLRYARGFSEPTLNGSGSFALRDNTSAVTKLPGGIAVVNLDFVNDARNIGAFNVVYANSTLKTVEQIVNKLGDINHLVITSATPFHEIAAAIMESKGKDGSIVRAEDSGLQWSNAKNLESSPVNLFLSSLSQLARNVKGKITLIASNAKYNMSAKIKVNGVPVEILHTAGIGEHPQNASVQVGAMANGMSLSANEPMREIPQPGSTSKEPTFDGIAIQIDKGGLACQLSIEQTTYPEAKQSFVELTSTSAALETI